MARKFVSTKHRKQREVGAPKVVSASGKRSIITSRKKARGNSSAGEPLRDDTQTHEQMMTADSPSASRESSEDEGSETKGPGIDALMKIHRRVQVRKDLEMISTALDSDVADADRTQSSIPGSNWRRATPQQDRYGGKSNRAVEGQRSNDIGWISGSTIEDRLHLQKIADLLRSSILEEGGIENAELVILAAMNAVRPLHSDLISRSFDSICKEGDVCSKMTSRLIAEAMGSLEGKGMVSMDSVDNPEKKRPQKNYILTKEGERLIEGMCSQENEARASAFSLLSSLFASEICLPG
jgi:hypothetical protein